MHSGKEAAEHIRKKYAHFKDQIATAEDFIALSATKSELSGKNTGCFARVKRRRTASGGCWES